MFFKLHGHYKNEIVLCFGGGYMRINRCFSIIKTREAEVSSYIPSSLLTPKFLNRND